MRPKLSGRENKTGAITMISNEPYLSYNRPMLTKSIVAGLTAEQIAIESAGWYEENKIYQILGRQIVSVDTQKKEVCLDDGSRIHFTKLIYALGSECFVPDMKGSNLPEVVAIRRLADVDQVKRIDEGSEKRSSDWRRCSGTGSSLGIEKGRFACRGAGGGSGTHGTSA